jgi:hypothetical protein
MVVSSIIPVLMAATLLMVGTAWSQETATTERIDPEVPQAERICEQEIAEAKLLMAANIDDFGPMDQARMDQLLAEAEEFCADDNEVMAAIRLEALQAIIEVTGATN